MKRFDELHLFSAVLMAAFCTAYHARAAQMATQPWVTNRIAQAEARVVAQIPPALTTNDVRAIVAESAPPADLTPATNYTDSATNALSAALNARVDSASQAANNHTDEAVSGLAGDIQDGSLIAQKASEAEVAKSLLGGGGVPVSGADVVASLDTKTTTNDVCNIVTNEVPTYGEWVFHGYIPSVNDVPVMQWTGSQWMPCSTNPVSGGEAFSLGVTKGDAHSTALSWTAGEDSGSSFSATRGIFIRNTLGLARLSDLPSLTNGLIGAAYIATNNPAFVEAVTNCPVAIAEGDAEALAEWGIYGGGTIGALLAALAAAVAALKKKKMPLYPVGGSGNPVNATYDSGVLTVSPFSMAAYAPTASAAFSVAMGTLPSDMESGKARDAVLVIDCTSLTDGQEPTVTWGVNFHPRTDAGTDFACMAGAKNVYYISEYAAGEFAVGGWMETAGGNA